MRVAMLRDFGPPDVLTCVEVSPPRPGAGQVLIRNEAIGVNFRDTWIRAGTVPASSSASWPLILGNEVGGIIAEIGDGVSRSLIGTRVVTSTGGSGGYAEYALARVQDLFAVPDNVDIDEATAVFVQGRVALGAYRTAQISSADRILILGAAGGVGTLLTQLAAQAGAAAIIGANLTRDRAVLAERFGATHAIEYQEEVFSGQLRAVAPNGVDVVFDGIGGPAAQTAFDHLATGTGRHVVYGYSSGTPLAVDAAALVPRGISLLGFGGQASLPGVQAALVTKAFAHLAEGTIRPVIGQQFPLAEAHLAHQAIEARKTTGKTLLHP